MGIGSLAILFLSLLIGSGIAADAPSKAGLKSITVYQDPG